MKITRTIASTNVTYAVFDGDDVVVKQITIGGKRTAAQAKKIIDDAYKCDSLIKETAHTAQKYSMDVSTFMRYAAPVTENTQDAQTVNN